MEHKSIDKEVLPKGTRFLYRRRGSATIAEGVLLEWSPSGSRAKFDSLGWLDSEDIRQIQLVEILAAEEDRVCPNCISACRNDEPCTRNYCRGAPRCSPELDRYLRSFGL